MIPQIKLFEKKTLPLPLKYRISSYKTRGYYFFVWPSNEGIIRMRVLFEGGDYSKRLQTLENKARVFTLICIVLMTTLWVYNNDYFFF